MKFRWFVALSLVFASVLIATTLRDRTPNRAEFCVADVGDVRAQVDLEQAQWASLMAAIAHQRGLPPRATTIAIATASQESRIHNIDYGDRDSIGLFQQRPSQGWGTIEQIMDPYYSTGKFYDALVKVPGYATMDINDAAQTVQRSGFPDAYAQHENYSRALASALRGYSGAKFTCQLNPRGTGSAKRVQEAVGDALGSWPSSREGDTVTYPLSGDAAAVKVQGWTLAHFLVANAARLNIHDVSFRGRTWTVTSSHEGWRTDDKAMKTAVRVSVR